MKKQEPSGKPKEQQRKENEEPEGYPSYPKSEDIYQRFEEVKDIDPEDLTKLKEDELEPVIPDQDFEFDEDIMGTDLDVPGSELDDEQEEIGNEDEENNYYSIGGDKHKDLEEDQGEIFPDIE